MAGDEGSSFSVCKADASAPGPAHLSWPGKKLPFHFIFPALRKGSSHRGKQDDKAYSKFKVGIVSSKSIN